MHVVRARLDGGLRATLSNVRALRYRVPPAAGEDVSAHVRAASALRRWRGRRVVIQDDVRAFALLDADDLAEPILLDADALGRRSFSDAAGTRHFKPDFEAAVVLPDGRLAVFGSGAEPPRECVVILAASGATLRAAPELYAALAAVPEFRGAGINLEGAVVIGERLLLFQRGVAAAGSAALNAIGELPLPDFLRWLDHAGTPPVLTSVRRFDLGTEAGVPLGFTDACALPDGRIAFLACAENAASSITDGPVLLSRFGILDSRGDARVTDILDAAGRRSLLKWEGLEPLPGPALQFEVVADVDSPDAPALLAALLVEDGPLRPPLPSASSATP